MQSRIMLRPLLMRGPVCNPASRRVRCSCVTRSVSRSLAINHPKFACLFATVLALIVFHYFTLWLPTLIFYFILLPGPCMPMHVRLHQLASCRPAGDLAHSLA